MWHSAAVRLPSLLLILLAASACAPATVSIARGAREYVADDYPQVLQRWTREQGLVQAAELDQLLNVTATYESWDFRWAYVGRYAHDYRLTTTQRRELLSRTLAESENVHEFYVALYGTKWRWSDLTKPESSWVVRLIDDKGNETAPTQLARIKPGPLETRYFPYTTVWRQAFRVAFPATSADGRPTIAAQSRWFGLRFAGPQGNEELRWEVRPDEVEKTAPAETAAP